MAFTVEDVLKEESQLRAATRVDIELRINDSRFEEMRRERDISTEECPCQNRIWREQEKAGVILG